MVFHLRYSIFQKHKAYNNDSNYDIQKISPVKSDLDIIFRDFQIRFIHNFQRFLILDIGSQWYSPFSAIFEYVVITSPDTLKHKVCNGTRTHFSYVKLVERCQRLISLKVNSQKDQKTLTTVIKMD